MNDLERELRDRMNRTADDVHHVPRPSRKLVRRARLRRARTVAITGTVALALVFGGFAGARSLLSDEPLPPAPPRPSWRFADVHGWIAYQSGSEIMAVDPADPGQTILLGSFHECPFGQRYLNRCGDGDPIGWSLDGSRLLVFIQVEGSGSSLYVLGDDGTRTLLSKGTHWNWGALSPDGSQVVYFQERSRRGPYLVDVDGGTPQSLADPCPRKEVRGELMGLLSNRALGVGELFWRVAIATEHG